MARTRDALERREGRGERRPGEILVIGRNGTRVAMVGFSTYPWIVAHERPGVGPRAGQGRAARRGDRRDRSIHAGAEGPSRPTPRGAARRTSARTAATAAHFTRIAIDAGADLVLGSGPHVLRGMEVHKGRLVAYSLGNLAGWRTSVRAGRCPQRVLAVRLDRDGRLVRGRVRSLLLDGNGIPHPDPDGQSETMMRDLSDEDFGKASPWKRRGADPGRRRVGVATRTGHRLVPTTSAGPRWMPRMERSRSGGSPRCCSAPHCCSC